MARSTSADRVICLRVDCSDDACIREQLIHDHLPLARSLARRFARRGVPLEDLEQVASLALVRAAERYEPDRGKPFGAYATPTIVGEIKHHFRDRVWDLHVPRRVQELHVALHRHAERLTAQHGRSPSLNELALAAGAPIAAVLEALRAADAFNARSIDASLTPDGTTLAGSLASQDTATNDFDTRLLVTELLSQLPSRERLIVQLRYFENMSQNDIADRLGISQMHVSRLLTQSLITLRRFAQAAKFQPV